jgi:phosphatidylserine/phosphatidylglycerophosphate/cardiolipin synthase-like enzyme
MAVALTIAVLRDFGWVHETPGGDRRLEINSLELSRFADKLDGAADGQNFLEAPALPQIILTHPRKPARLVEALAEIRAPSTYWTRDSFVHLASQAVASLRIMAPFVDDRGVELLEEMFGRSKALHRVLVLRPTSRGERPWKTHLSRIARLGVQVREYWYETREPSGSRRVETFHAKVIVGDDQMAYVGSSNFLTSSLDISLECGVLLCGPEVSAVAALMNAIEIVSGEIVTNQSS